MKYTIVTALLVLTLSIAGTAQLGSSDKILASVPFDFVAWNTTIPAGDCVVERVTRNPSVLTIGNFHANTSTLTMTMPDREKKASGKYSLVFHKYGNRHFLREIRTADGTVYKLSESKLEREMLALNQTPQEEILLASAK